MVAEEGQLVMVTATGDIAKVTRVLPGGKWTKVQYDDNRAEWFRTADLAPVEEE